MTPQAFKEAALPFLGEHSLSEDKLDMVCPEHDNIIYYYQDSSDYFRQFESVN